MAKRDYWGVVRACVAVAVATVMAVSCVMEEPEPVLLDSDKIAFGVAVDKGFVTKGADVASSAVSSGNSSQFLCAFGEDSIYLSVSEQNNSVQWTTGADSSAAGTKGAPIVDPSGSGNVLSEFWVSAKLNDGTVYFADDQVQVNAASTNRYWPPEGALNFLAYAPVSAKVADGNFVFSDAKWTASFEYSMPVDATDGNDATILPDYVYAIATNKTKNGGTVALGFHHAFSAICFKVGTMPKNVVIKHIALNGIYSNGSCSFVEGKDAEENDILVFTWSGQSEKKLFKQNFNVSVNGSEGTYLVKENDLNTAGQTFMVVPQVLPVDAAFEVCFSVDGVEYTLSKPIKDITDEWVADKKYVYSISIPEEVDIDITDDVNGAVKDNLKMTNKGLAYSYIRSAVIGYWIFESGSDEYIVADWKETDGEFVYGAGWNEHWKLNEDDGFYYYKYQLAPGQLPAVPLFESYTVTAVSPVANAKLQLNVMVQAVIASELGKVSWPWGLDSSSGWFVEGVKQ